jgi:hypothetical protein
LAIVFQVSFKKHWSNFSSFLKDNGKAKTRCRKPMFWYWIQRLENLWCLATKNAAKSFIWHKINLTTAQNGGFQEFISDPKTSSVYRRYQSKRDHQGNTWPMTSVFFGTTSWCTGIWNRDFRDNNMTLAGDILAQLQVSTSGTDSDWIVK